MIRTQMYLARRCVVTMMLLMGCPGLTEQIQSQTNSHELKAVRAEHSDAAVVIDANGQVSDLTAHAVHQVHDSDFAGDDLNTKIVRGSARSGGVKVVRTEVGSEELTAQEESKPTNVDVHLHTVDKAAASLAVKQESQVESKQLAFVDGSADAARSSSLAFAAMDSAKESHKRSRGLIVGLLLSLSALVLVTMVVCYYARASSASERPEEAAALAEELTKRGYKEQRKKGQSDAAVEEGEEPKDAANTAEEKKAGTYSSSRKKVPESSEDKPESSQAANGDAPVDAAAADESKKGSYAKSRKKVAYGEGETQEFVSTEEPQQRDRSETVYETKDRADTVWTEVLEDGTQNKLHLKANESENKTPVTSSGSYAASRKKKSTGGNEKASL